MTSRPPPPTPLDGQERPETSPTAEGRPESAPGQTVPGEAVQGAVNMNPVFRTDTMHVRATLDKLRADFDRRTVLVNVAALYAYADILEREGLGSPKDMQELAGGLEDIAAMLREMSGAGTKDAVESASATLPVENMAILKLDLGLRVARAEDATEKAHQELAEAQEGERVARAEWERLSQSLDKLRRDLRVALGLLGMPSDEELVEAVSARQRSDALTANSTPLLAISWRDTSLDGLERHEATLDRLVYLTVWRRHNSARFWVLDVGLDEVLLDGTDNAEPAKALEVAQVKVRELASKFSETISATFPDMRPGIKQDPNVHAKKPADIDVVGLANLIFDTPEAAGKLIGEKKVNGKWFAAMTAHGVLALLRLALAEAEARWPDQRRDLRPMVPLRKLVEVLELPESIWELDPATFADRVLEKVTALKKRAEASR